MVDGDSCKVLIDCGFDVRVSVGIRLKNVNTPELNDADADVRASAVEAKLFTTLWVEKGKASGAPFPFTITTDKSREKWGRWVGVLSDANGSVLNDELTALGYGVKWS